MSLCGKSMSKIRLVSNIFFQVDKDATFDSTIEP